MSGTLFLVAVPIGNRDDLTIRAREVLGSVDVVAAEDTRHYATLARHHGIGTRAVSLHDHNEESRAPALIERLAAGEDVALVSDAGTPLVSDPGFRLVQAALEREVPVTVLPGASAVVTALVGSGLPTHPFRFMGFLPRTAAARRAALVRVAEDDATLVAFETPHRLTDALRDAVEVLGDRRACLARSLTKPHERFMRGTLAGLISALEKEGEVRGECTVIIGGAKSRGNAEGDVDGGAEGDARLLLDRGAPPRAVRELLVGRRGMSRRAAYDLVLRLRGS